MSEQQANFIKAISFIGGFFGAAICVYLGLKTVETNLVLSILLLILATVFLMLIYPLFQIGKLVDELAEQDETIRTLEKELAEAQSNTNTVNQYSPLNTNTQKSTVSIEDEKTIVFPAVSDHAEKPEKHTPEMPTKEISMTKHLNTNTGELLTIPNVGTDSHENSNSSRNILYVVPKITATLAAGELHTVAVRYNGSVVATGQTQHGQCDISEWRDIVSICAGGHHTIALKENGTVIATGYNGYGQCDVAAWKGVCALAAGTCHTVGLLENGRCVAKGDNTYGQCDVHTWTDIVAVTANANYTVGLKADGNLVAVGADIKGNWDAFRAPITALAAGSCHTIGLKADGTVVARGNNTNKQCDVARWNRIVAIAAGNFHSVGLCSDGTVVAVGHNGYGECEVETWKDVIAISAGRHHTVALTKNGNILATGENTYGQCTVADMSDIKTFGI